MKNLVFISTMIFMVSLISLMSFASQDSKDKNEITQTITSYVTGWYTGNSKLIGSALHPELAKRGPLISKKTGDTFLDSVTKSGLIEYTKMGYGNLKEGETHNMQIIQIDIFRNMASAKVSSKNYVDYLHLAKIDGKWQIINVLWQYHEK